MNYNQLKTDKYNLYHIQTDKFAVNRVLIKFNLPFSKEKITLLNVFSKYVARTNKNYKTIKDIFKESEKRYLINLGQGRSSTHEIVSLNFFSAFPDKNYLGLEKIENIFDFLFELTFETSFENNEHNLKQLEIAKNKIFKNIQREKENKAHYANQRFNNIFFKGTPYEYDLDGSEEHLKNITLDSLLQLANEIFYNSQLDIFTISSFEVEKLNSIIEKRMIKRENKIFKNNFIIANDLNEHEVKEQIIANQSILKMAFVYDTSDIYEINAVIPIFIEIFGGSGSSLLFQEVREKHSLCYHISASGRKSSKYILVNSGISSLNYEKTKKLVLQELNKIKEGMLEDKLLASAKMTLINSYKAKIDSKSELLDEYEKIIYFNDLSSKEIIEMLLKVNKEDVINFASKLRLSFTYFLEGVDLIEGN